ncbi:MAG: hypothetical protein M3P29_00495 [Acidobacteriota bacterium]|nr:hypothetical protein [Acidobacteriota bacterium]
MKRLLLSFALALFATAAFGQAADRDVLVTPDGTVYTLETQTPSSGAGIEASRVIGLSIQNGADMRRLIVPESVSAGFHFGGALAYDSDSKTLFVLWIHMPNGMSSELLLASYRDGKWQPAVSIDNQPYHVRNNLRVGITRRVPQLQKDGSYANVPALLLHAIWWDDSGRGEEARYALLTVDKGVLASAETHSLQEFVSTGDDKYNSVDTTFNAEILRHPAIVSSPMQNTVDVVFGDTKTNSFHGVTLHPIADVRIHIPVGIGGGGAGGGKPLYIVAPTNFNANWTGPISVLARADRLVFANEGEKALNYITYSNGTWSSVKSIAIDNKFPAEAAIAAIDKMLSTQ